jgi:hypothetical protein
MRIYVRPKSKADLTVQDLIRVFGATATSGRDSGGAFYDVALPPHWIKYRRERFEEAIKRAQAR